MLLPKNIDGKKILIELNEVQIRNSLRNYYNKYLRPENGKFIRIQKIQVDSILGQLLDGHIIKENKEKNPKTYSLADGFLKTHYQSKVEEEFSTTIMKTFYLYTMIFLRKLIVEEIKLRESEDILLKTREKKELSIEQYCKEQNPEHFLLRTMFKINEDKIQNQLNVVNDYLKEFIKNIFDLPFQERIEVINQISSYLNKQNTTLKDFKNVPLHSAEDLLKITKELLRDYQNPNYEKLQTLAKMTNELLGNQQNLMNKSDEKKF